MEPRVATKIDPRVVNSLEFIVKHHGAEILDAPLRLEALLRDYCADDRRFSRDIHLVIWALKLGAFQECKLDNRESKLVVCQLQQRIHDKLGTDLGLAEHAALVWLDLFPKISQPLTMRARIKANFRRNLGTKRTALGVAVLIVVIGFAANLPINDFQTLRNDIRRRLYPEVVASQITIPVVIQHRQEVVDHLLLEATGALKQNYLTKKVGNSASAADWLGVVLALEPQNVEALRMMDEIARLYLKRIRYFLSSDELSRAREELHLSEPLLEYATAETRLMWHELNDQLSSIVIVNDN